jgi:hypothetical protein
MKKPVMRREMFIAMAPKSGSKGIMSGFDDEMEIEDYEDRTPENLEIIANNLRGDIRSMDERYLELAQMVGESAFETPEEVIALMQSQMGQQQPPQGPAPAPAQQPGGIAALGGATAPQAPQGIMQGVAGPTDQGPMPGMEQMPQPGMEQPVQMAHGGVVHRQMGSPPTGEVARTIDPELFRQGTTRNPGILSRMAGGFGNVTSALDDRVTNFLRNQVQTTGPVSRSGNPIPFVDKSGRFYQPVGGTNPNMPSRGFPSASAPSLSRMAGRFLGPVGFVGGFLTNELVKSDANKGQLYGSTFGLETGEETANLVGGQPVFPEVAPDAPSPETAQAVRETGFSDVTRPQLMTTPLGGQGPSPEEVMGVRGASEQRTIGPAPGVSVVPPGAAPKAGKEDKKKPQDDLRKDIRDRMEIYSEFLGSDAEARKAQALFLLAEAALNVAGAPGRSTAERLAKGLKGLPSGMAAIAAETDKEKRSIAAAAISSVEQEYTDARKASAAIQKEIAKKGAVSDKVRSLYSSIIAREPNMNQDAALQLAVDMDNGSVVQDKKTSEWVDILAGTIRYSPHKPLGQNSVGFIDPNNPYVSISKDTFEVVSDPETRAKLLDERRKLQQNITKYDSFMRDVYGDTVGVLPTIRSGASRFVLGLFGDVGFGLTDTQLNQIRDNQAIGNEFIKKNLFRNSDRVSNLDMKNAESLANDPNKLFTDVPLVIGTVQNFQRSDTNRLAEIDSQLFGVPTAVMSRVPQGSKTDPLPVTKNTEVILRDAFTKRPNLDMHLSFPEMMVTQPDGTQRKIPGRTERVNIKHPYVQQLLQGTAQ